MTKLISTLIVVVSLATPAMAQTWSSNAPKIGPVNQPEGILIQAYPSATNHCAPGYQPVVVGGAICCGIPNASYSAAPAASYSAAPSCPVGTKGCS